MEQKLNLDDGWLAYDDEGTGPLVVQVPSMGDLRQEYRFLTPQLVAAGFRVVSLDLRGLGASSVGGRDFTVAGVGQDLAALITSLGAGPAAVVADSMGAGAAVWLAAERPDLVSRLVLMGPFVRGVQPWFMKALYMALFSGWWGAAMWAGYYTSLYPSRKPADFKAYTKRLKANLKEPGRLKALRAMLRASKAASEARLPRVKAPALVLMGSRDPDFPDPRAEAAWVGAQLKAPVHIVEGAGHYPHAEFPEETAAAIRGFLLQTTQGR